MNLFKSIATFGGFTLLSRITGFFRDMVLANFLGAGLVSDAFFVAFKLPNLFRSLFAEGAFTSAFVPMLSQKLVAEKKQDAIDFAAKAISVLAFFLGIFVIVMEFIMPVIVQILAPGFVDDNGKIELATTLSRITFPFLLFISIVSFQSGVLNSLGKFAAPAAAPIILNLMMIASVFIFVPFSNTPAHGIAFGVTFAGFIEILWLMFFLHRQQVWLKPDFHVFKLIKDTSIRTLFKRITPGVLGAGIYQINMVVDTILVSLVGTGAISWLYYANRLQQLPLGVVGAAIGVAVLPILSQHLKSGNDEEACQIQDKAIEYGAILSIPAAVALIILAEPIINILFQHGKFGTFETIMTSQAVIAYAIGLPAYVMVKALAPNFFARGDTKTPVKYSMIVLLANLSFAVILMKPFGHVGIATATTIAAFVSLYQYLRGLKKRCFWKFTKPLGIKTIKIIIASLIMGASLQSAQFALNLAYTDWLQLALSPKIGIFTLLCILGVATFTFAAKILGILDAREIIRNIFKKGKKAC
ncbi:MAG: murein biosynthesis integral membrane protein MurJ [Alphaproteobacteria bacterium]|nr:murein biosynthesis integral membrane protein MurJ [Alphaproteobacteria bacterium]MBQ7285667.1 murein biosynthesis integral membrane protein MurJ [Alphaproteobacteria bacterium]